jgi:hypothetical protein
MSGLFGSPPTPPSPLATAGAQTATNVGTALANTFLNNYNQNTPQGSLTYDQTGNYTFNDPYTGAQFDIPRFTQTQTLSPAEQKIFEQSEAAKYNLASLANNQSGKLNSLLGTNISLNGAPIAADPNSLKLGTAVRSFGDDEDYNRARAHVEDALFQRIQPQLQRDRAGIEQSLADQGIRYGSPAYAAAMDNYNRQSNDARLAVTQAGAAEQQQAFGQAAQRAAFGNAGLAQQIAQQQQFLNAQNLARQDYLTEQYALRNQPINEISALLSGSQVSRPDFRSTPINTIPTTDVAGLMNTNFSQQFGNYKQQAESTDKLIGGIFGLAGNVLGPSKIIASDRRFKEDIHKIGGVMAATPQKVQEMPVYEYSYKDDPSSTRHIGPMAQDVEKIDPGAVAKDKRGMRYIDTNRIMGSILKA